MKSIDWNEVGTTALLFLISSGLLAWLIRTAIKYFIELRLKTFQLELNTKSAEYKLELDKQLKAHEAELKIIHDRASKLYDKRLIIIHKMHKRLVALEVAMKSMTQEWKLATGNADIDAKAEKERVDSAIQSYNSFIDFYDRNRIFFSEQLCRQLEHVRNEYYDSLWDYTFKQRTGIGDVNFNFELARNAASKVKNDIPPALRDLEAEFRRIIGV